MIYGELNLKLWLLRPYKKFQSHYTDEVSPWNPWYGKAFGFVVRAETEEEARKLASEDCGEEGKEAWVSGKYSGCMALRIEGKAKIIIRDFASA